MSEESSGRLPPALVARLALRAALSAADRAATEERVRRMDELREQGLFVHHASPWRYLALEPLHGSAAPCMRMTCGDQSALCTILDGALLDATPGFAEHAAAIRAWWMDHRMDLVALWNAGLPAGAAPGAIDVTTLPWKTA